MQSCCPSTGDCIREMGGMDLVSEGGGEGDNGGVEGEDEGGGGGGCGKTNLKLHTDDDGALPPQRSLGLNLDS